MELALLKGLSVLGPVSKLQLMQRGLPYGIIQKMTKIGMLERVSHPTKICFRVADGIFND